MQKVQYITYREGDYVVARGLNLEISSFGTTEDEATANFKEAVALYFEDASAKELPIAHDIHVREVAVNA